MTAIADSEAVKKSRVLTQHQAALSLLKRALLAARGRSFHWLDLACGKGQILQHLEDVLPEHERKHIEYEGYDGDAEFAREAERQATKLGFAQQSVSVGELRSFSASYPNERRFDFVTMTNTMHELASKDIASLLIDCIERLSPTGHLYLFDMEKLEKPELGAIEWKKEDFDEILLQLFAAFGCTDANPGVQRWRHTTTTSWSVILSREHMPLLDDQFAERRDSALHTARVVISDRVEKKFLQSKKALESLTRFGPETTEDSDDRTRTLYEFWGLYRAREVAQ